ncbi:hypothetical protein NKJ50_33345 [Mesorhizobium sp. M0115]|uniref:hypothetical protein n=1 Tax=Mesorhizobium sp. M0115 TaxID=2956883 RepID=UPI00333BC473
MVPRLHRRSTRTASSLAHAPIDIAGNIFPSRVFRFVPAINHSVDGCIGNEKTCAYFPHLHRRNDGTFLARLANAGVA